MKDKINEICTELNDGKIAVVQATEQLFDLYSVSGSFYEIIKQLINVYEERETKASNNGNWSEAFQNEIRVGVLNHLIAVLKQNDR